MNNEFRIVKIIDDYKVVVNAGCDFFEKNDILEVYVKGEDVIDPLTGESLGTLDKIKARLKVSILYEKMCLCVNEKSSTPLSLVAGAALSSISSLNASPDPLDVNLSQVSGGFDDINMTIEIGDLVRKAL